MIYKIKYKKKSNQILWKKFKFNFFPCKSECFLIAKLLFNASTLNNIKGLDTLEGKQWGKTTSPPKRGFKKSGLSGNCKASPLIFEMTIGGDETIMMLRARALRPWTQGTICWGQGTAHKCSLVGSHEQVAAFGACTREPLKKRLLSAKIFSRGTFPSRLLALSTAHTRNNA